MKKAILFMCALAISGCSNHQKTQPQTVNSPVQKQEFVPTRHADWQDIKGTTWSLQLPSSFKPQDLTEKQKEENFKFAEFSEELNTLVVFSTDTTDGSVEEFTLKFNSGLPELGGKILEVKVANPGKGVSGLDTTLTLLTINDSIYVVQFISKNKDKVYLLSCSTSEHPKEIAPIVMKYHAQLRL
jgi:hypothetical protein